MPAVTRRVLPLAAAGLVACTGIAAAAARQEPGIPLVQGATKVTICHATASETNPYVQLQIDDDAIVKHGHTDHPDDIIPPFDYVDEQGEIQHYPGKNLDAAHQAILNNGCNVPPPPEPEQPTPLPIQPIVKCVDTNGATFTAVFGYSNPNMTAVTIAAGEPANSFDPGGNVGQPSTFQTGAVESAVTVPGTAGSTITWNVTYGGETSSASATASFPTQCSTPPAKKITICHATSSENNPYNLISVDVDSIVKEDGHDSHLKDIIPPFDYVENGDTKNYPGKNWDATGQAILANDCEVPTPTPTPKPIRVSVTCVHDRGSTFDATFGYVNPNGSPVDIPSGPDNNVTVGATSSMGQPTTFKADTVTEAFTISGPAGSDIKWSVTYAGKTNVATANEAVTTKCGIDPPDTSHPYRIGVFVNCVTNNGDNYSATFGYGNEDTKAATIPAGDANRFFPVPEDRGQPTTFDTGNHPQAVTVRGIPTGTTLVWSVTSEKTRTAEASANFEPKCNPDPPPAERVPIGLFVNCVINHADTYDAVYGYTNDNRAEQIVPLGLENTFLSAPGNRGQPTTFEPGTVLNAVTVTGISNGTQLTWVVRLGNIRAAVASASVERKCEQPPQPPTLPPPDPKPPESGLSATCVLRIGSPRTYDAIFGYANASGANAIIPVGSRNFVAPAPVNRGQPRVFRPGIVLNAFAVKNIPRKQNLTWTVRIPNGEIRTATATARFPRNCITAPAPQTADLVLTKTVADGQLTAGQRGTYTIHVLNRGPNIALRVRIVDDIDARLELLSASTTRGSCTTSGRRVLCTIAALPPGAAVRVIVAVRARGAGTIRNVAEVTHSQHDPTPGNNVDSATVVVTGRTGGVSPAFTG